MKWSEFKALSPQVALEMVKSKRPDLHKQMMESVKGKTITKEQREAARQKFIESVKN